ncbi:MAG: glycosyl transferase family 90 [Paludibacter sp.]|nr:glycosyl transferase family 90 [Paludibacter sp.]
MFSNFKRLSFRHKNNKLWYYFHNYLRRYYPLAIFRAKLKSKLEEIKHFDSEYIYKRVNYYNRLDNPQILSSNSKSLSELKLGKKDKTYYFDSFEFIRYFNQKLKARFLFGDVTHIPDEPSIVKSRPINGEISNSVLLNLDKVRHFLFVKDKIPFINKKDMLVGRAKAHQPHRIRFLELYFNHPLCNIGQVNRNANLQFLANRMTISEHLKYKFILCLEGNDVASNLKWVMSSNSLAVMPKPVYETWFMEGTLIPDYHYVLIKDDYSDLEERLKYYIKNTDKALQIIENAHIYVNQFKNKKQEELIPLLVLQKYFVKTGQNINL